MKRKKLTLGYVCILFLVFSSCISSVFAGFKLGDSSLPVDEDDFIIYDFNDNVAEPVRIKVEFVKMFQKHDIISTLVSNITVSELNSSINSYKVLTVDNMKYQNQTCLIYNKTHQYFRYEQYMNNLLVHGYGGYYIIPDDPVDINIVREFIESYTAWTAIISDNTVTIDIANDQAILTYNQQGILIKEEIKSNNVVISTLTLIENEDDLDFRLLVSISVITVVAVGFIIGIIFYKKSR